MSSIYFEPSQDNSWRGLERSKTASLFLRLKSRSREWERSPDSLVVPVLPPLRGNGTKKAHSKIGKNQGRAVLRVPVSIPLSGEIRTDHPSSLTFQNPLGPSGRAVNQPINKHARHHTQTAQDKPRVSGNRTDG